MQLDEKYALLSSIVVESFKEAFDKEIDLIEKKIAAQHMGWFKIVFKYISSNYNIVFESDRDLFNIIIYDNEGARSKLDGKYDNETNEKNIRNAVLILKNKIDNNDLSFCVCKFRKNSMPIPIERHAVPLQAARSDAIELLYSDLRISLPLHSKR